MGSPAIDVSHFIYCCANTKKLKNVDTLLKIYYNSFETTLAKLGLNANDCFSYQKLIEHWKKYSKFGLFLSCFVVKFSLCESDEVMDFVKIAETGEEFDKAFRFETKNQDYLERVESNLLHYVHNLNELK